MLLSRTFISTDNHADASGKIESSEILTILSIRWCTGEIESHEIMLLTPKLFEFRGEIYH